MWLTTTLQLNWCWCCLTTASVESWCCKYFLVTSSPEYQESVIGWYSHMNYPRITSFLISQIWWDAAAELDCYFSWKYFYWNTNLHEIKATTHNTLPNTTDSKWIKIALKITELVFHHHTKSKKLFIDDKQLERQHVLLP